ncbi:glycosyltransferase family 2 protein [Tropicimonas sp. TH_r6]|uniref:glycosyltransferase family 2 protein n=1 Tax=Tropicimonas sp. TH_r6 TaxID=3082085 RepID=UPI0029529986|nr:glycosyltransferase family 2 protein [Tropicimonas sp. TH_r6]MDV7145129.1 glycosyltransferase family 2 protein [Tropicimonas sp. TH_r6]
MTLAPEGEPAGPVQWARDALRLRWKRRRTLWRSLRSRHQLDSVVDRTGAIRSGQILAFTTLRNEIDRLPHFMEHNRLLGVSHFLVVDNDSDDGSAEWLAEQPDVSLWSTGASYKASRFGVDWLGWLQMRHGHGHWCLTVDADELLLIPHWPQRTLSDLSAWLEERGDVAFGALMLDLYPKGPLAETDHRPGARPLETLAFFDAAPYRARRKAFEWNLWVQGGVRDRLFFADRPQQAPTLNKLPFIRWNRRYAYRNSTHSILPRHLNLSYDGPGDDRASGILLHTKFLPSAVERSVIEKRRREHFGSPGQYDAYYDAIAANPDLWTVDSVRLRDWRQLEELGLLSRGAWR